MPAGKMEYVNKYQPILIICKKRCKANPLKLLFTVIIVFIPALMLGQSKKYIVHHSDYTEKAFQHFNDSLSAVQYVHEHINQLQEKGYLLAHYTVDKKSFTIQRGRSFKYAVLNRGNLPARYLGNYGFEEKFRSGNTFSHQQVSKLFNRVISLAESDGYPFAQIKFDSIAIDKEGINAVLAFQPGPLITYDSIRFIGDQRVNRQWLASFLNVRQGAPFQEKQYKSVKDKIDQLDFLSLKTAPALTFQNDQATLILDTEYIRSNKLDAIIGFAPKAGDNAKLLITGEASIDLHNLFQRGHNFSLKWRSVRPETQELNTSYYIPNIFNSPAFVSGSSDLYKQDSAFFNHTWMVELGFQKYKWQLAAYSKFFRSSVQQVKEGHQYNDITIDYIGLRSGYSTKGLVDVKINGQAGIGKRTMEGRDIKVDNLQTEVSFSGALQYSKREKIILLEPAAHFLINKDLMLNDLLRIGGIGSLRGFPENFFFVKSYSMMRSEYHWVFGDESSFFALLDAVYMDNVNAKFAYSTGLGFDMKVNSGIFEIIYAVGGYENSPISFEKSVIHFGYKAIF